MNNILISIKQKYASLILEGTKTEELRRTRPSYIVTFLTPIICYICHSGKVHGYMEVRRIDSLEDLYDGKHEKAVKRHQNAACVTPEQWEKYHPLFAWNVGEVFIFNNPIPLSEFGVKCAPQSWQYLTDEQANAWKGDSNE